jgi:hypothetical protein
VNGEVNRVRKVRSGGRAGSPTLLYWDLSCHACGKLLGRWTDLLRPAVGSEVTIGVGKMIGAKVSLAPGFVNARVHHPRGCPRWLIRAPDPSHQSPANLRLPLVVTCSCGASNGLAQDSVFASQTSRHDRGSKAVGDILPRLLKKLPIGRNGSDVLPSDKPKT